MLSPKRLAVGVVAIASLLGGCGSTKVEETGGGGRAPGGATSRALSFAAANGYAYPSRGDSFVERIHALDFDGDGHIDLAVVAPGAHLAFMRNAGDGTFEDAQSSSFFGADVTAADLNGDGLGDIIATDFTFNDANSATNDGVWAIYGAAAGTLSKPVQIRHLSTDEHTRVLSADMDGDGVPEIIGCGSSWVDIVRVDASGTGHDTRSNVDANSRCSAGDVDGNGRADLVTVELRNTLGVWLTDERGALPALDTPYPNELAGAADPALTGIFAADLNGDGRADVIYAFGGKLLVRVAKQDGSLADPILVTMDIDVETNASQGPSLAFADFDGDGHLDAVMSAGGGHGKTVVVLLGDGMGNLREADLDLGLAGGNAYDLTAADFDGDGLADIAIAYGTRTYVLHNTSH